VPLRGARGGALSSVGPSAFDSCSARACSARALFCPCVFCPCVFCPCVLPVGPRTERHNLGLVLWSLRFLTFCAEPRTLWRAARLEPDAGNGTCRAPVLTPRRAQTEKASPSFPWPRSSRLPTCVSKRDGPLLPPNGLPSSQSVACAARRGCPSAPAG